ncbi:MAG: hypothetical protein EOO12_11995, partial [Chitinophagaceae bacterium]
MKYLPLLLSATLLAGAAEAQSTLGSSSAETQTKTKVKTKTATDHPWAVKWNPLSLGFGKIGLSGERSLGGKKSVTFGVGIP